MIEPFSPKNGCEVPGIAIKRIPDNLMSGINRIRNAEASGYQRSDRQFDRFSSSISGLAPNS